MTYMSGGRSSYKYNRSIDNAYLWFGNFMTSLQQYFVRIFIENGIIDLVIKIIDLIENAFRTLIY